jgi:trimeric autotransporter adhesin
VNAIAFDSSGNLYIGGSFNSIGNVRARNIARWNGTRWDSLSNGISEAINTIVFKHDTIYAAGDVHIEGGDFLYDRNYYKNVYAYSAGTWKVDSSISLGYWSTHAIEPCPYTGYKITKIDFDKNGKLWMADNFNGLETFTLEDSLYSYSLVSYTSGKYYTGTWYYVERIDKKRYDGTTTGDTSAVLNDYVSERYANPKYAVTVDKKGVVYYGGNFSRYFSNIVKSNNIELWDGKNFYPIGSGVNGKVFCLAIDPDDSLLYVGGDFTIAGNISSPMIAAVDLKKKSSGTESYRKTAPITPRCFINGTRLSIEGFLHGDKVEVYSLKGQLVLRSPCISVINIPKASSHQLIVCMKRNGVPLFSAAVCQP